MYRACLAALNYYIIVYKSLRNKIWVNLRYSSFGFTALNRCPRDELLCYVAPSNGIFFCTVPHCNSHIGMLQFKVANDQWKEHSQCIELEHRDVKAAWKQKLTESHHLVQRYRSEGEQRQNDVDNLLMAAKEKLVSEQVSGWLLAANHVGCNCEPVMRLITGSYSHGL